MFKLNVALTVTDRIKNVTVKVTCTVCKKVKSAFLIFKAHFFILQKN